MTLTCGMRLGPYEIAGPVGAGGMGEVYKGRDTRLDRTVAIKILSARLNADPKHRSRFDREARTICTLSHPHICTLYDVGDWDGTPYLVMEYLAGETLAARLKNGALAVAEVLNLGVQIADALDAAHAHGIVHRDLKPSNVMLTDSGVKLLDFGLAKPAPGRLQGGDSATAPATTCTDTELLTSVGRVVGTVAYMSPEQARGEAIDARSDVFSLGIVLYEMATGRAAFSGTTAVIFDGILNRRPPAPHLLNEQVPAELETVIARAIEKDRDDRFQTCSELADELRRLQHRSAADAARGHTLPPVAGGWTPAEDAGRRGRSAWRVAGLLLTIAIVLGILGLWQRRQVEALGEGDSVLVTDFANTTGDPVFDATLKQALAVKLEESPFLTVTPEQRVQETLRFMQRSADAPLTREVARDVCHRQGIKAIIAGGIARLGANYVLTLTAETCATGDVLAREQVEVSRKEAVLAALGKSAVTLRGRLGESLASVQKLDKPIEQATTSSLDALRAFSLGDRERARGGEATALQLYRRAVELDPDFAMAHARLGTVYGNLGEAQPARDHRTRAFALRDRVSERERLYITAHYYNSVEGDGARAAEVYELWKQTYPRDAVPYINLGTIYRERGDDDAALQCFLEAIGLAPTQRLAYENAFAIYTSQGKVNDARALVDRERQALGEHPPAFMHLFQLDAMAGDTAAMDNDAARLRGTMYEGMALEIRAAMAARAGRLAEYRRLHDATLAIAARQGLGAWSCLLRSSRIVTEAMLGNASAAATLAAGVLRADAPSVTELMDASLGLSWSGDVAGAERALRAAASQPRRTRNDRTAETLAVAAVEWRRGRPGAALARLEALESLSRHDGRVLLAGLLRAEMLLAMRRTGEAETQFQIVLDRRAVAPFDVAVPLAQLGVARARARAGAPGGSRAAYEAFFAMWNGADADVPILVAARRDYARTTGETTSTPQ